MPTHRSPTRFVLVLLSPAVLLALAASGCDPQRRSPDAAVVGVDAPFPMLDAAIVERDAPVVTRNDAFVTGPDAFLEGPDAVVAPPDAFVVTPDAFTARPDAVVSDTGPRVDAFTCGGRGQIGGRCAAGACFSTLVCEDEVARDVPSVRRVGGGVGRPYPAYLFPGGRCGTSCDLNAADSCDACSTCVQNGTDGAGSPLGECFLTCTLDPGGRGGCPEGYACDRGERVCAPECTRTATTDTCQYTFEDRDGFPGNETIVDEGAGYRSTCNLVTGRCDSMGTAGATAGDDCVTEFDCEDDGFCVVAAAGAPPSSLSDGYCVRVSCDDVLEPCASGDVCTESIFGLTGGVCMQGCAVGSETTRTERVGATGHNPGCDAGEACFWDGVHGSATTLNGACFPGNYNAEPAYNVGSSCLTDSDCWSAFGLGRCLFTTGTAFDETGHGICAMGGCGQVAPGDPVGLVVAGGVVPVPVPAEVCDVSLGDQCVVFDADTNYCMQGCTSAADCAAPYACPDLGTAAAPLRICWPFCEVTADCRSGTSCRDTAGGSCDPVTEACFCS